MTIQLWLYSRPPGIDKSLWADYVELKRKKKHTLTERALNNWLGEFKRLTDIGYDGTEMLTKSYNGGWIGAVSYTHLTLPTKA